MLLFEVKTGVIVVHYLHKSAIWNSDPPQSIPLPQVEELMGGPDVVVDLDEFILMVASFVDLHLGNDVCPLLFMASSAHTYGCWVAYP